MSAAKKPRKKKAAPAEPTPQEPTLFDAGVTVPVASGSTAYAQSTEAHRAATATEIPLGDDDSVQPRMRGMGHSAYLALIEAKSMHAPACGIDDIPPFHPTMKPHQVDVTRFALRRGRAALFLDTGLGKTRCAIEFARIVHEVTGGNVLILCPLAVAQEFVREAAEIGVKIHHALVTLRDGINVTNYDKLHLFPVDELAGVVLDEASILKHFEGKMRNALIAAFATVPFRLVCTATPAPNDHVELGNYAEFLGAMTMSVMKAKFFSHKDAGEFELKEHGKRAFWQWVASWAAIVRRPSDLGYSDEGYDLPPIHYHEKVVQLPHDLTSSILEQERGQQLSLIPEARTLAEQRDVRRESIDLRAAAVAQIVATYPETDPILVWVELNPEGDAVRKAIPGIVEVAGSDDIATKEERLVGFKTGNPLRLVTKPKIGGWGLNYQHCRIAIFIGGDHSWEKRKQTIARIHRFGQRREVDVWFVVTSADGRVVESIRRKEAAAEQMYREMVEYSREFVRQNVLGAKPAMRPYEAKQEMIVPAWLASEAR